MRLFDDIARTDGSPAPRAESHFAFLNRVDRPFFAASRDLLEEWFTRFPSDAQRDLQRRFRSDDNAQHEAAFWELYLHEIHRALGFELDRDPVVPGTSKRPDFLVLGGAKPFYLEATVVSYSKAETAQRRRSALLIDMVNEAFNPDFSVMVGTAAGGPSAPRREEVVGPIEKWLSTFDWDDARALAEAGRWDPPERVFTIREDSILFLRPGPKPPDARGDREAFPTVSAGPRSGGILNEGKNIYDDLHDKASRYGQPDHPFVLAALCTRELVEDRDVEFALYGPEVFRIPIRPGGGIAGEAELSRNPMGLWQRGTAQRATRVSAVLTAVQLAPWWVAGVPPTLWTNPWATKPLEAELPWRTISGDLTENRLITTDATRAPHEILGLAEDWPGPGRPFED